MTRAPRILVFGSRHWDDPHPIVTILNGYYGRFGDDMRVIEGGAKGADAIARNWAAQYKIGEMVEADWDVHDYEGVTPVQCHCQPNLLDRDYCHAAGNRRNQKMIDEKRIDIAYGFANPDVKHTGTIDMEKRLEAAGIHYYVTRSKRK